MLSPIITGGGQEFGLRSGTENVPAIVGFGKAVELAVRDKDKNSEAVKSLKDYFWRGLKKIYPQAEINGDAGAPHILRHPFPDGVCRRFTRKTRYGGRGGLRLVRPAQPGLLLRPTFSRRWACLKSGCGGACASASGKIILGKNWTRRLK